MEQRTAFFDTRENGQLAILYGRSGVIAQKEDAEPIEDRGMLVRPTFYLPLPPAPLDEIFHYLMEATVVAEKHMGGPPIDRQQLSGFFDVMGTWLRKAARK